MSLLLCRPEPVRHPYYIEILGIHIYSSQELCYVIYNNPLLAMEDFLDTPLLTFIRDELNLEALAGCVDDDEGKPRLLFDGRVAKYDPVAAQNARAVQRRMASVV